MDMTIGRLLQLVTAGGGRLMLDGGRLAVDHPPGLAPALLACIRENRATFLAVLTMHAKLDDAWSLCQAIDPQAQPRKRLAYDSRWIELLHDLERIYDLPTAAP